jgi:hypothetical protein
MKHMMLVLALILSTVACGQGNGSRRNPGTESKAKHRVKINVRLEPVGTACKVVHVDTPVTVHTDEVVYWRYKNKCRDKNAQRIDPLTVPIDGDCKKDTQVKEDGNPNGNETDSDECKPLAPTKGPTKYKIDGDVVLDPELDIQPPVLTGGSPAPTPTPTPSGTPTPPPSQ